MDILAVRLHTVEGDAFAFVFPGERHEAIGAEFFRPGLLRLYIAAENKHIHQALELPLLVGGVGRNGKHGGVLREHIVWHSVLIVLHGAWEQQTEHQEQIGKKDANKQNHIAAQILENHPQTEPGQEGQKPRQWEHPGTAVLPQIPAEKF